MNKITLSAFLLLGFFCNAQSVIQTLNSGSVIGSNSSVSVGEIVIVPTQNQSNSGIIGIIVQINQQQLEVNQFELSDGFVVFPNPTTAKLFFKTKENLVNEKVAIFNNIGQLVLEKEINSDNSIDLSEITTGIYIIQFVNKNTKSFKIIKH